MGKSLAEIYKLAHEGELKKEDLKNIEGLFGKYWENNNIDVVSYADAEKFYCEHCDVSNEYGMSCDFWADIDHRLTDGFSIELKGSYANWSDCIGFNDNTDISRYEITDLVKNEFKKMGLDPKKPVDDISLRCALYNAVVALIKTQEIEYLQEAAN